MNILFSINGNREFVVELCYLLCTVLKPVGERFNYVNNDRLVSCILFLSYIGNIKLKSTRNSELVAIANRGVATHNGNATGEQDMYRLIESLVFKYQFN